MKIGEQIGDYEVVEVLGSGGMGQVYKVRNLLSERMEAMKVLLPNLAGDPELAERFLREIKLQASLDHPNLAKLHTAFRDSNQLLMVMEFVDGVSVEKLLAHGALLTHDAINYASQVLAALAYAHARGVVHRDIKPANLMRTPSGTIKLLDFGIAHIKADYKLTQAGTTLGSLYYIAPELINGSEPDPRCDIYSLGVVLYEMVTGTKPFQGDSQFSILSAHMQATPVAPAAIAPWLAGPVNDVILKAMAKDPAQRFQTAEAFKNAMESAAGAAPDQAATQVMPSAPTQALPASAAPAESTAPVSTQAKPAATMPVQTPASSAPASMAAPSPQLAAPGSPAVVDQMPTPQAGAGHRGLYVALGSLLTLAVLAAAALETPKFFKTHADQAAASQQAASQPVSATPVKEQAGNSSSTSSPETQPATPSPAAPSPATSTAANESVPAAQSDPAPGDESPARAQSESSPPEPPRAVEAKESKHTATAQARTQDQAQAAGPSPEALQSFQAQMRDVQTEADQLNVRVKAAKAGLSSIKTQMASQGLGLRSDVLEAEARMNHLLEKAQREIASGDAVGAEHDLQMAGYAIDFIDKFLGH